MNHVSSWLPEESCKGPKEKGTFGSIQGTLASSERLGDLQVAFRSTSSQPCTLRRCGQSGETSSCDGRLLSDIPDWAEVGGQMALSGVTQQHPGARWTTKHRTRVAR